METYTATAIDSRGAREVRFVKQGDNWQNLDPITLEVDGFLSFGEGPVIKGEDVLAFSQGVTEDPE